MKVKVVVFRLVLSYIKIKISLDPSKESLTRRSSFYECSWGYKIRLEIPTKRMGGERPFPVVK